MEREVDWTKVFTADLFKAHDAPFLSYKDRGSLSAYKDRGSLSAYKDRGSLSATSKSIHEVMKFTTPELEEAKESIGKELDVLETDIAQLPNNIADMEDARESHRVSQKPNHPKSKRWYRSKYENNHTKLTEDLKTYEKSLQKYNNTLQGYKTKIEKLKEELTQAKIRQQRLSQSGQLLIKEIKRRKAKSSQKGETAESSKTKRTRKRRSLKRRSLKKRSLKKRSRKRRSLKRRSLKRRSRK